jgi:hypothetical protein
MSKELDLPSNDKVAASLPKIVPAPDQIVTKSFLEYIKPFWKEPVVCPVCRTEKWTVLNTVDPPLRYTPGFVLSLIPVICDTCKYVMLFSGTAAGIFDADGNPVERP